MDWTRTTTGIELFTTIGSLVHELNALLMKGDDVWDENQLGVARAVWDMNAALHAHDTTLRTTMFERRLTAAKALEELRIQGCQ